MEEEKKVYHHPVEHSEGVHAAHTPQKSHFTTLHWVLLAVFAVVLLFNQWQVGAFQTGSSSFFGSGNGDLSSVDVTEIQSTAQGIALLFPVNEIKTDQDAISVMISTGTPEYGDKMGVSYDDPVGAENSLADAYPALKAKAKEDSVVWDRYIALAAAPRGISCEFCCGIGAQGISSDGSLRCGCAHNPAVQALTLWLMMDTDYSDAEILKEVYKFKTLWFPRNMVGLALQIAGGDSSVLSELPGQVGGC